MRLPLPLSLVLLVLAAPSGTSAQCGTDTIPGYVPPSALGYDRVRVVGEGFPSELAAAVGTAIGLWNGSACNTNASSFPLFQSTSTAAQFTVTVAWSPGASPTGGYGSFNRDSRQITMFGQIVIGGSPVNSLGHNPQAIGEAIAHELGHFLGLADAPSYCWAGMMMTAYSYNYSTGEFIHKTPSETECETANGLNATAVERPRPGTPGSGPGGTVPQTGPPSSPIVVDLGPRGFHFSGLDDPVRFDIDADGRPETISWIARYSRDAFLVLDRNGNGHIDDGSELFGTFTDQPAAEEPNGFLALAQFDREERGGNVDGVISDLDEVFESLRLWFDTNHDGVSQGAELVPLRAAGLDAIDLDFIESRRRDRYGNRLRWASLAYLETGERRALVDVIFVTE